MRAFTPSDWIENFRVSRDTFLFLCHQLKPAIQCKDTQLRKAICNEHRLAITLWCLATSCEYCTIGQLFGVARCTVCVIIHDTWKAIVSTLQPIGNDLENVVDGFSFKWQMIQCAGAIDGSHIPVHPPALNHTTTTERAGTLF